MGLEKLGVLFLMNYANQVGAVRNHLLSAVKEVLLAVQTSFEIVSQTGNQAKLGGIDFISPLMEPVQKILSFTINKVSPEGPALSMSARLEEGMKIKEHVVASILSAIDEEIENTRDTTLEKNKMKLEALQTVKQVLVGQRKKGFAEKAVKAHVA